jgi:hypothetical protein
MLQAPPALSDRELELIRARLDNLIEAIGPHDARGILELSQFQRDHVTYFMNWLEDRFGDDDDDT